MARRTVCLVLTLSVASHLFALTDIQTTKIQAAQSYLKTSLQAQQAQQNQINTAMATAAASMKPATTSEATPSSPPSDLTQRCDCYVQNSLNNDPTHFLYDQNGQRTIRTTPYCECESAPKNQNLPVNTIQQQVHLNNQINELAAPPAPPASTNPGPVVTTPSTTPPTFHIQY